MIYFAVISFWSNACFSEPWWVFDHFNIFTCFIVVFIHCVKRLQYFVLKPFFNISYCYTILLYNLVWLKLWEGFYCFAFLTCFTMLPLSQISCFLDVWDILYYLTIFSTLLLYCMWLYYIFILLQIYYIANVSYSWVLFSVLHFYSIIFVSYNLNVPYCSTLVMFFTILHFYWIEFVADLFLKHLIISS